MSAVNVIKSACGDDFRPQVALILGSGLSRLADDIDVVAEFSYADLPGFFVSTVVGHAGMLRCGYLAGVPVVCMRGRAHFYEGAQPSHVNTMVGTLAALGAKQLIVTNAAGGLDLDIPLGSAVLIEDQINFQGINPLVGPNDETQGPRFLPMEDAFDPGLRKMANDVAVRAGIDLPSGVYVGVLGPNYETPAEIRMFKAWGADLVGMSTVAEVLVARHRGMSVLGFSAVTNYGVGLAPEPVNHDAVLTYADAAATNLTHLVMGVLAGLSVDQI